MCFLAERNSSGLTVCKKGYLKSLRKKQVICKVLCVNNPLTTKWHPLYMHKKNVHNRNNIMKIVPGGISSALVTSQN